MQFRACAAIIVLACGKHFSHLHPQENINGFSLSHHDLCTACACSRFGSKDTQGIFFHVLMIAFSQTSRLLQGKFLIREPGVIALVDREPHPAPDPLCRRDCI